MEMKKLLAIGIIFLFIGVAVAPSINSSVVKTSDDLVEVTSQACGIQGFGNTTVKLTKQQYQNLEQYLVDFRARLNQTTTMKEVVPIFKDAVVELNKYRLLPKGMSVEKAQRFVTGQSFSQKWINIIKKVFTKNQKSVVHKENWCCLFYGRANYFFVLDIFERYFEKLGGPPGGPPDPFYLILFFICQAVYSHQPFFLWCPLELMRGNWVNEGNFTTFGLNGKITWKGDCAGDIDSPYFGGKLGATGYTGLKIYTNLGTTLLGSAFHVAAYEVESNIQS
jgi:hypothetical protein